MTIHYVVGSIPKTQKKMGRAISKVLKQNQRAIKVSGGRVALGLMQGDASVLEREIQSRIDKGIAKKSRGVASGSGAYGRGAYAYGRGSYTQAPPAVNSLFNEYAQRRVSKKSINDETGRVIVSKREYVMRVVVPPTPSDFSVTSLAINPGLSGVFAWLSQVAANYDEYELRHLVFHYKPVISVASQSGAMGSVVIACNYNAGAPKFESFREMVEYSGAMETRICDQAFFGIECDPKKGQSGDHMYVRTGAVPSDEDIKTYDTGLFQIATSDINATDYPAGTLLGHLYVEYDVVLGKPKLYASLGKGILGDLFRTSTCSKGLPLNGLFKNAANSIGGYMSTSYGRGLHYQLPDNFVGTIMVNVFCIGTMSSGDMSVPITANGEVTPRNICGTTGASSQNGVANTTSLSNEGFYDVKDALVADGNYIHLNIGTTLTFSQYTIYVTMVSPDYDSGAGWILI